MDGGSAFGRILSGPRTSAPASLSSSVRPARLPCALFRAPCMPRPHARFCAPARQHRLHACPAPSSVPPPAPRTCPFLCACPPAPPACTAVCSLPCPCLPVLPACPARATDRQRLRGKPFMLRWGLLIQKRHRAVFYIKFFRNRAIACRKASPRFVSLLRATMARCVRP